MIVLVQGMIVLWDIVRQQLRMENLYEVAQETLRVERRFFIEGRAEGVATINVLVLPSGESLVRFVLMAQRLVSEVGSAAIFYQPEVIINLNLHLMEVYTASKERHTEPLCFLSAKR